MSNRLNQAASTMTNMNNMADAIEHIRWTIAHSPQAYALFRKECVALRVDLVNAEIKFGSNENGK